MVPGSSLFRGLPLIVGLGMSPACPARNARNLGRSALDHAERNQARNPHR